MVTITTVGYGDKAPKTWVGRLIAVGWMLMSLFVVSIIVGQITTMMTLANLRGSIQTVEDLPGKSVGVVAGTVFDQYLTRAGTEPVRYPHSIDLFRALSAGKVDAVLSDTVSGLLLPKRLARRIKKAGSILKRDDIALGLPQESPYREAINRALTTLYDNGGYDRIYDRWFGDGR